MDASSFGAVVEIPPDLFEVLTWASNPGWEPCMVGSLTGAVSS